MDEDLGNLVSPPQSGGWTDFLKDPINRSALLSFGMQAMTGGWGNGTQQLAAAMGAGATGAAGTAHAMQLQTEADQARSDKLNEGAKGRASHEAIAEGNRTSRQEIAGINAANRTEIEGLKNDARFARIAAIHGPNDAKEWTIYAAAKNRYLTTEKNQQLITRKSDEQITTEAETYAKETLRGMRAATLKGDATSINSPPDGAAPTGGVPATGAKTPPTATLGAGDKSKVTWDQVKALPGFEEAMSTEAGQQRLLKDYPHLGNDVYRYNAMKGRSGYRGLSREP